MTGFAVVRHPDVAVPGIVPAAAFELKRIQGWYRVSDWRDEPSDFHLPEFAEAPDLDAPEPAQEPKSPAVPEKDEEPA